MKDVTFEKLDVTGFAQSGAETPLTLMRSGREVLRITAGGEVYIVMEGGALVPVDHETLFLALLKTRRN